MIGPLSLTRVGWSVTGQVSLRLTRPSTRSLTGQSTKDKELTIDDNDGYSFCFDAVNQLNLMCDFTQVR